MKCFESEKNIDLLLDDEASELVKHELKAHLMICEDCRNELQLRQQSQHLLRNQPPILPTSDFDKRMLAAFEKKLQPKNEKSWWAAFFLIPKPAFALAIAFLGLALAFLLGRMSVASPPQLNVASVEKTPEKIVVTVTPTPEIREVIVTKTQEKVVTKYINVPVVKEKVVEKIVYVNKPSKVKTLKKDNLPIQSREEYLASRFNLKDLQPVANVTYQIIKKGENNED